MGKITVNKNVFWDAGGRKMSGKVKQILSDHALVRAEGCEYLVRKASLSTVPMTQIASLICTAAGEEMPLGQTPGAPKGIRISFDPSKPMPFNMKWIDAVGMAGCDPRKNKIIGRVDALWKRGSAESDQQWNPELFGKQDPPPGVTKQEAPIEEAPQEITEQAPVVLPPETEAPELA